MKKTITIICCVLLAICAFSLIPYNTTKVEAKNNNSDIVGSWTRYCDVTKSTLYLLQFTDNGILRIARHGSLIIGVETYNYSYNEKENTIEISDGEQTASFVCYIEGNGMITDIVDEGNTSLFTKA